MTTLKNDRFLRALLREPVDTTPVWMMRQAGRYLPEYRAIREKTPTKKMMQDPEIATEITLQPLKIVGVDAAIVYSDILMIPDALGMNLDFVRGEGPKFGFALNSSQAFESLNTKNVNSRLGYVFETIRKTVASVAVDFPVLGFAGAPFTVACYMIAGGSSSHDFSEVKSFAWQQPELFHSIMSLITECTIQYLIEQAHAGVTAIQLFDTWAGLLSPEDYGQFCKPYTEAVFVALQKENIPTIHYIKAGSHLLEMMAEHSSSVMSVDWRTPLQTARQYAGTRHAIQGNFDPDILMSTPAVIEKKVAEMLKASGNPKKGYIANLGHGIGQFTPVSHACYFIEQVKKQSLAL